ncbi:hypothetical protein ASPU41_14285 [Arthrobacter sp. U41]|nr:hypothetical protein ASPU41_14285 [Arthrobacter sp. U41]
MRHRTQHLFGEPVQPAERIVKHQLGALILFVFLLPTAFLMHAFGKESYPQSRAMEQVQFLKDLSLAGTALVMFAAFAALGDDLDLVIAGPLLNFR